MESKKTRYPKLDKIPKKVSFDTDQLEVVADLPPSLSDLGDIDDLDPENTADTKETDSRCTHSSCGTIPECTHGSAHTDKACDVHLQVRSVTFANSKGDDASERRRLCRTPTPYWPRSESPCSPSLLSDASFDDSITEDSTLEAVNTGSIDEVGTTGCHLCQKEATESEVAGNPEAKCETDHETDLTDPADSETITKVAPSPRSSPSAKRAFLSKRSAKFNISIDKDDS